jgi:hypothetical protein
MTVKSANAIKHGITARKHRSADQDSVTKLANALLGSRPNTECLEIAEQIAEIQTALGSVRREKARACAALVTDDIKAASVESLSTGFDTFARQLATLDEYERKLTSRRRKLCFKLLSVQERG